MKKILGLALVAISLMGCKKKEESRVDMGDFYVTVPSDYYALSTTTVPQEIPLFYAMYNDNYFSGKLPGDTEFKCTTSPRLANGMAQTLEPYPGHFEIDINPEYCAVPHLYDWFLLHEMAHIATYDEFTSTHRPHGPRWQKEIQRLKKLDAFDDLY